MAGNQFIETLYCSNLIRIIANLYIHTASILLFNSNHLYHRQEITQLTCALKL